MTKFEDMHSPVRRCFSEFSANVLLYALAGLGACVMPLVMPRENPIEIAFTFAFAVMLCIHVFGPLCYSHMSPFVTIAAMILGHIQWQMGLLYILMQLMGTLGGYGIAYSLIPKNAYQNRLGLMVTTPNVNISLVQAAVLEFVVTSLLIFICCAIWDERNKQRLDSVSLKFGLAIWGLGIVAGPWTGCSLNFFRSMAAAIFNNYYSNVWIYFVAHAIACTLIPVLWRFVFSGGHAKGEE